MENKGFTLVELLAVIAILALLALASFEALDVVNKGNKKKAESVQIDQILTSAISYVPTSKIKLPSTIKSGSCRTITYQSVGDQPSGSNPCDVKISLAYLHDEGVLEEKVSNPKSGKDYNMNESYVHILYVTSGSNKNSVENSLGKDTVFKYDGNYLYYLEAKEVR